MMSQRWNISCDLPSLQDLHTSRTPRCTGKAAVPASDHFLPLCSWPYQQGPIPPTDTRPPRTLPLHANIQHKLYPVSKPTACAAPSQMFLYMLFVLLLFWIFRGCLFSSVLHTYSNVWWGGGCGFCLRMQDFDQRSGWKSHQRRILVSSEEEADGDNAAYLAVDVGFVLQ